MEIVDLTAGDREAVRQAAQLLVDLLPEGWPAMDEALKEVEESFAPDRISRVARDGDDVLAWIGGIEPEWYVDTWELHPLVVREDRQRQGIGRALVTDLEQRIRERGGANVFLGTDDHRGETSMGNVELYPDPLAYLARLRNIKGHPFEFYQRQGYTVVGCLPDASAVGQPDIFMAKRIVPLAELVT